MDISKYISELLYEHDCVIIPGFGGFVCNYKPAEIHPIQNTISPPSKAISFNRNLRTNDGLLLNHIANREQTSFDEAFVSVYAWVNSSNSLLQKGETVVASKIGTFHNNIEGNLQFTPDESVNYLKSSFGLRTITAEPVLRGKQVELTDRFEKQLAQVKPQRNIWRIAAAIFLIAALASVISLMQMGVEIKPLNLDEASVFNVVSSIFKTNEPVLKPIPVEAEAVEVVPAPVVDDVTPASTQPIATTNEEYYVIVGAFSKRRNVEAARTRLEIQYPGAEILVERTSHLTRVGFAAGNNYEHAMAQLATAQQEDSNYWLFKK